MDWPQLPDYGCIPRWPQDGNGFVHPDDVSSVTRLFPGDRVFRRDTFDGLYYHCSYGKLRFRLRPCLWLPVRGEGLDIGDRVETTGIGMVRDLFVGTIVSMRFVRHKGCILYRLASRGMMVSNWYQASEFRVLAGKSKIRPRPSVIRISDQNVEGYRLQDFDT